jgi:hypothetical protein
LFGDGSVDINSKLQVCLSNNKYNKQLLSGLSNYIYKHDHTITYEARIFLQINSIILCDNLKKHFNITPNKTYMSAMKIPTEYSRDFIRGFFDADGWITIGRQYNHKYKKYYPRYCWGVCSYLLSNMLEIQKNIPIKTHILKKKNQELFELRTGSFFEIKSLSDFLYYDPSVLCLENKKCKMLSIN